MQITLTYPLQEPRSRRVLIDRSFPGAIFGLAYDFYRDLYAEDQRRGGKAGPVKGASLRNRGFGPLVWGHDLGDLLFETVSYRTLPPGEELGAVGEFTFGIGS